MPAESSYGTRWRESTAPGTALADSDEADPMGVMIVLLPRLWVEPDPVFRPLAEEAAQWARNLPDHWERAGRPCERVLVDAALDALDWLPSSQGPVVLIHQILHGQTYSQPSASPGSSSIPSRWPGSASSRSH